MMGADEPPELRGVIPNAFVHICPGPPGGG
jgi:hypothetical protein